MQKGEVVYNQPNFRWIKNKAIGSQYRAYPNSTIHFGIRRPVWIRSHDGYNHDMTNRKYSYYFANIFLFCIF